MMNKLVRGKRHGLWELFYQNGQLKERGNFKDGYEKDGLWEWFDEDGNLTKTKTYRDGVL